MIRADVCTLITETPGAHGVYDETEKKKRTVLCTVRSASYRDIAAAGTDGLRPELVFRLANDFEYQDEKTAVYKGTEYNIDRVYYAENENWVELTCSRGDPHV